MRHAADPPELALPEPPGAALARKFVRVTDVRADGLVAFKFAIGWPELSVDLLLPRVAFDEFCVRQRVQHLDADAAEPGPDLDPDPDPD